MEIVNVFLLTQIYHYSALFRHFKVGWYSAIFLTPFHLIYLDALRG